MFSRSCWSGTCPRDPMRPASPRSLCGHRPGPRNDAHPSCLSEVLGSRCTRAPYPHQATLAPWDRACANGHMRPQTERDQPKLTHQNSNSSLSQRLVLLSCESGSGSHLGRGREQEAHLLLEASLTAPVNTSPNNQKPLALARGLFTPEKEGRVSTLPRSSTEGQGHIWIDGA